MAIYSTLLGAQHRMERVPVVDPDESQLPAVGTDTLLRNEDLLPAVSPAGSGESTGSSPIFDLLNQERPGVITLEDATAADALAASSVALHYEQLPGHTSELHRVDPVGLSADARTLQGSRANRSLVISKQVPELLGRLARAEITATPATESAPEFEIIERAPQSPNDARTTELLGPSFQEMSGNNGWLWLLALSDHPVAPFAQLSLVPTELGPSITGQLDPLAQKRVGFLG